MLSTAALAIVPAIAQEETEPTESVEERTLQTVVVRGAFIPAPQRETSQVASFLSEEDLIRQGDANAALALTRVSGLSVVSDKFAFVRGLGDRYSSALLNGSPLPSPEPLRRTVPLDLFPSNILGGAAVQKTYSANYPGEFGGGVIDLKTVRIPSENFFNVKLGVGYNTESTPNDGLFVRGSDTDWSGYDDGLRDLPGPVISVINQGLDLNDQDDAFVEAVGESFVNTPLTVIQTGEVDPDLNATIDFGRAFDMGRFDVGIVGVVGFESGWTTEESIRQTARLTSTELRSDIRTTETTYDATLNGLGSVALGWDTNEIQATLFYVHTTSKEAQINEGDLQSESLPIFEESSGWFERELYFTQLAGEHQFGDFDLNWRGSYSFSGRDAPYERTLTRFLEPDGVVRYAATGNNAVFSFSELEDENYSFGIDGGYLIALGDVRELLLTGGIDYSNTERDSKILNFEFQGGNSLDDETAALRPDFLFSQANIDPARFVLDFRDRDVDFYIGELEISSAFLQGQIDITNFINATIGARYEEAEQSIVTTSRFGDIGSTANLENDYILPTATVTWNFADDLQLRLGYSETISRPQFRELSPSIFNDPDSDRIYQGNEQLQDTEFTNYDARLEYYMGRNQFITLAAFYKEIINPIEEFSFINPGGALQTSFINAPEAELLGAEFEFKTRFEMPIDQIWFNQRDWLFSFNYTYTSTEISAGETDLVAGPFSPVPVPGNLFGLDGAQLQGTPENILNLQFGWDNDVEQATLLLNWVDERILQRGRPDGTSQIADVLQDPGVQLDFVYRRDLTFGDRDFTLGLSARNLLGEKNEEFQLNGGELGRTEFNTYERGTSLSASVTAKF
ncbi:MAG: TonB-dependent receptor [Henriciella sp.]|nr:TonB-dependent receptor [Henriciella sp.]